MRTADSLRDGQALLPHGRHILPSLLYRTSYMLFVCTYPLGYRQLQLNASPRPNMAVNGIPTFYEFQWNIAPGFDLPRLLPVR